MNSTDTASVLVVSYSCVCCCSMSWCTSYSARKSLGGIPFRHDGSTYKNGQLHYAGQCFGLWDSLGQKDFATLSDGTNIDAHRIYRDAEVQLAIAQLAHKKSHFHSLHAVVPPQKRFFAQYFYAPLNFPESPMNSLFVSVPPCYTG